MPGGTRSTFLASGSVGPSGLAFDSAGNLFATDNDIFGIYEFTPSGTRSTFRLYGMSTLLVWPLTARAICLCRMLAVATSMNSGPAERAALLLLD